MYQAVSEPAVTRTERWHDTVSALFGGIDIRWDREPDERDELVVGTAGPLQVVESRSGPGQAFRTTRHIRHHDPNRFLLFVQSEGTAIGEQYGHCTEYRPGDLGLLDLSVPMRCTYTERRAVMLTYPKSLSPFREEEICELAGVRIDGGTGSPALISSLVRQLPEHLDSDEADGVQLGMAVLDLLHVALAAQLDRTDVAERQSAQQALRSRCEAFIESHLPDPELGPAMVADAHHISLRYLQRLFEDVGGVATAIRQRRLQRCRRDLLDPGLLDRPVAALGARWGFRDPAHFNRLFKDTFEMPPAEFRQTWSQLRERADVLGSEVRTP